MASDNQFARLNKLGVQHASLLLSSMEVTAALWPSSFLSLRQGGWKVNSVLTRS